MNEKAESGSARTQHQSRHSGECAGALGIVGLFVAVWILAYAFAVMGWNIAGDKAYEADISTGWHELGAPTEIDIAKRR